MFKIIKKISTLIFVLHILLLDVEAQNEPYSFFIAGHTYGKPGTDNIGLHPPFKEKFNYIQSRPEIKFGVLTGDIVKPNPVAQDWDEVDADIDNLGLPVYFAVGNHDMENRPLYESRYGITYYSFTHENDLFIVLDPNIDGWSIKGEQLHFLKNTLLEQSQSVDHIFVLFHQVLWRNNTNIYQTIIPNSNAGLQNPINFWTEVIPLFYQLDNQVTFCSGDLGAASWSSDFMYDSFSNISFIGSGMGKGASDNFIILNVDENKNISYDLICLDGDNLNCFGELTDHQLSRTCFPDGIEFRSQAAIDSIRITYPNCTQIMGDMNINGNNISHLDSLSHLMVVNGSVEISNNIGLNHLKGFQNIFHINQDLIINSNPQLRQIQNFSNLSKINGSIEISDNPLLTSFTGLDHVSSTLHHLDINSNAALEDISSIRNIKSIYGTFSLINNSTLNDITALENIELNDLENLIIEGNSELSNCAINNICNYLDQPNASIIVSHNKEKCNTEEEIINECSNSAPDHIALQTRLFPNPSNGWVYLQSTSEVLSLRNPSITIINSMGQILGKIPLVEQKQIIDLSLYSKGICLIIIKDEDNILETHRVIIE